LRQTKRRWTDSAPFCIFGKKSIKIAMSTVALTERITALPADLQAQVADFVEFLMLKHRIPFRDEEALSPAQQAELHRIWAEYEAAPDEVISVDMLQEQTKAKYGL
jgi:hypothetical protein